MWLILWGLWAVFGCGWVKRSDGRRNSSQSDNGTVSPFVERGAAAVAVEAVGGGGLPRRTSQPRRRNNSAPREHFPPFVFPLPPLSGFIAHSQNNHKLSTFRKLWQPAALFFFFLFFLFPFLLLSFLLSFLLYYFSFRLSFRFSSFPFLLFRFSFFLSSHFCNRSGSGRGLALFSSFPPCSRPCWLFAFHNKTPGGVKRI